MEEVWQSYLAANKCPPSNAFKLVNFSRQQAQLRTLSYNEAKKLIEKHNAKNNQTSNQGAAANRRKSPRLAQARAKDSDDDEDDDDKSVSSKSSSLKSSHTAESENELFDPDDDDDQDSTKRRKPNIVQIPKQPKLIHKARSYTKDKNADSSPFGSSKRSKRVHHSKSKTPTGYDAGAGTHESGIPQFDVITSPRLKGAGLTSPKQRPVQSSSPRARSTKAKTPAPRQKTVERDAKFSDLQRNVYQPAKIQVRNHRNPRDQGALQQADDDDEEEFDDEEKAFAVKRKRKKLVVGRNHSMSMAAQRQKRKVKAAQTPEPVLHGTQSNPVQKGMSPRNGKLRKPPPALRMKQRKESKSPRSKKRHSASITSKQQKKRRKKKPSSKKKRIRDVVPIDADAPSSPSVGSPTSPKAPLSINIGDRVLLTKDREGIIKYIGEVHFADGIWFGLELINGCIGSHDGILDGKRYFKTKPRRAIFVQGSIIRRKMRDRDWNSSPRLRRRHSIEQRSKKRRSITTCCFAESSIASNL